LLSTPLAVWFLAQLVGQGTVTTQTLDLTTLLAQTQTIQAISASDEPTQSFLAREKLEVSIVSNKHQADNYIDSSPVTLKSAAMDSPEDPSFTGETSSLARHEAAERTTSDAGIDLTDPTLYQSVDTQGDSSAATVMGVATGYDLSIFKRFVGSLRKTGYIGHIILGLAPDVDSEILEYLAYRNVTTKILQWTDCTYLDNSSTTKDIFKRTTCAAPYPDIKIRWSRFPLARDWLRECTSCTGPILVMDVRDSLFQVNPFGPGSPVVRGLQVFEEHKNRTTQHWLTKGPIFECKGVSYDETMLCSGTTIGTRAAMLKYLEIMYEEMKDWISHPRCRFNMNGDDQSIHNHLFYSGQLPFATANENRRGGIVNTAGFEGAQLVKQHSATMRARHGITHGDAMWKAFDGASGKRWIGAEFNICDDEGYFTEFDGSRSRVVHQWDRFGRPYINLWLNHQKWLVEDEIPSNRSSHLSAA
jgi:hypothetical protein